MLIDVSQGKRPEFAAVWLCLFSGQLIEWYPYSFVVTTYTPLSPRRTRLAKRVFLRPRNRRDAARLRRIGLAMLDEVTGEDQHASEAA